MNRMSLIPVLVVALATGLFAGCAGERDRSPGLPLWLGGGSYFEAQIEGTLPDSLMGTAEYRLDADGNLVGVELNRDEVHGDGMSLELEPQPLDARTYSVIEPGLFDVARTEGESAATAFFVDSTQQFTAVRGTVEVTEVGWMGVHGQFDLEMEGTMDEEVPEPVGIHVRGSFQATEEQP